MWAEEWYCSAKKMFTNSIVTVTSMSFLQVSVFSGRQLGDYFPNQVARIKILVAMAPKLVPAWRVEFGELGLAEWLEHLPATHICGSGLSSGIDLVWGGWVCGWLPFLVIEVFLWVYPQQVVPSPEKLTNPCSNLMWKVSSSSWEYFEADRFIKSGDVISILFKLIMWDSFFC